MVLPYIQGLGEKLKRACNKQGIQVHFKGTNTIKQLLMAPKDMDNKHKKSGVIYKYKYPHIKCIEEYICESGRTFGDRVKEHLKAPTPIHLHTTTTTTHPVSPDCFSIVDRESQGLTSNIKEAMYIRVNHPSLNRNLGKFQLPHIWDQVLQDTPTPHLKKLPNSPNLPPQRLSNHPKWTPLQPLSTIGDIFFFLSLVSVPSRGASVPTLILPAYPPYQYSTTPLYIQHYLC